jgi:hypothetical protein
MYFEEEPRIIKLLERILRELRMIRRGLTRQRITTRIEVRFSGENMANSVELQVGQSSIATIEALASDGSASNGVISAVAFTFTNPDASFVNGADGVSGTVTGVEPSTGPIEGSVTCTVTDTDGAVSQFTQSFSVTVDPGAPPPPPVPTTASVQVNFSTPA